MTAALQFDRVSKNYSQRNKRVEALRDVSFSIREGEVFGFVGPNGAGKSTTIKVMLDIISDYQGRVEIYGRDARQAEARRDLAYVPEAPALYEQFTPMEILQTALRMYQRRHDNPSTWCMQWLERFSVEQYARRRIRQLSKGNVQRVALAHAMVTQPRFLVLDEPLSGLDPVGRKDVIDILLEYKQQGGAIFFTSHVLHDVERIADRFGFINQGQLLTTRSPQEVMNEHAGAFRVRYRSDLIREGSPIREGEYELELQQDALSAWLETLQKEGGQLMEVRPAVSLERVFFNFLERDAGNQGREQA